MRRGVLLVALREFAATLRGRLVPSFGGLFALLCVGIVVAGLGGSGRVLVQGFTRTAASVGNLALFVFPLLGLILGASAFSGSGGDQEILVASPLRRSTILAGRLAGLFAALVAIAVSGFGVAAVLIAVRTGVAGFGGFAQVFAASLASAWIGLALGALLGTLARGRSAAVGWALAAWFFFAVIYDLGLIALLQVAGDRIPALGLAAALALNPIDAIRTLTLLGLDAEVLLGSTGAAFVGLLGEGAGMAVLLVGVVAFLLGPPTVAAVVFSRRDF